MRFFFRSKKFKTILAVFLTLVVIASTLAIIGGVASPGSSVLGAVVAPFQSAVTNVSNAVNDFFTTISDNRDMMEENEQLKNEVASITNELMGYEEAIAENEFYKGFLEIKEINPDYKFEPATLISRDSVDHYGGFTINKGSLAGVSEKDPVITAQGLVGYVSEVAPNYSKVVTVLSPLISVGGIDRRTSVSGIVSGSDELVVNGTCRMYNLPRSAAITIGDYIVTSGAGIFPAGLVIGTVKGVGAEKNNISVYAEIKPQADVFGLRQVMIITYFAGQGTPSVSSTGGNASVQ